MSRNFIIIFSLLIVFIFNSAVYADSINVITLTDVVNERDSSSLLIGATEAQIQKYFPDKKMKNQIAAFLVNFDGKEILFDTGLPDGRIANELVKNNRNPENIKIILLTHLHGDHFGGLSNSEGKATFPNAEVYVSNPEYNYWVNETKNDSVIKTLKLYENHLHFFNFDDEVIKGVKAIDTTGHTPGHTSFLIESDNEKFLVLGDILHFIDIQLEIPEVAVKYDVDPVKAVQSRKFIFDYAAENNIRLAGMHTIPGIFSLKKSEQGYKILNVVE